MDFYLVALFCIAITLHNIEEAIWLPEWSQQASMFHKPVTPGEFRFAVTVITILAYLSAFYFFYKPESELAKWVFIGFLGSMIVNAIFPHLIATILMKQYAPGLLTGLFLNLPINTLHSSSFECSKTIILLGKSLSYRPLRLEAFYSP